MGVVNQATIDTLNTLVENLVDARDGIQLVIADELYNPSLIAPSYAEGLLTQVSHVFDEQAVAAIRTAMKAEADNGKRVLVVLDHAIAYARELSAKGAATISFLKEQGIAGIELI